MLQCLQLFVGTGELLLGDLQLIGPLGSGCLLGGAQGGLGLCEFAGGQLLCLLGEVGEQRMIFKRGGQLLQACLQFCLLIGGLFEFSLKFAGGRGIVLRLCRGFLLQLLRLLLLGGHVSLQLLQELLQLLLIEGQLLRSGCLGFSINTNQPLFRPGLVRARFGTFIRSTDTVADDLAITHVQVSQVELKLMLQLGFSEQLRIAFQDPFASRINLIMQFQRADTHIVRGHNMDRHDIAGLCHIGFVVA